LVNAGVPVETVRKRLGHRDIRSTLLYAVKSDQVADDEIRAWRRRRPRRAAPPAPAAGPTPVPADRDELELRPVRARLTGPGSQPSPELMARLQSQPLPVPPDVPQDRGATPTPVLRLVPTGPQARP
jgi:hypothetical protein